MKKVGLAIKNIPVNKLDLTNISIITQAIIEILFISLVENCVISCYNHLARGDYSGALISKMAA